MNVVVTADSQSHRLHEELALANVTHDETVKATTIVRVGKREKLTTALPVFFCNMTGLTNISRITPGDGKPIPQGLMAHITGMKVDQPGQYRITANFHANGKMNVEVIKSELVHA